MDIETMPLPVLAAALSDDIVSLHGDWTPASNASAGITTNSLTNGMGSVLTAAPATNGATRYTPAGGGGR
ncbi:MAG: hypothetical protein NVS2B16_24130 [Chloroflexota bacterium]